MSLDVGEHLAAGPDTQRCQGPMAVTVCPLIDEVAVSTTAYWAGQPCLGPTLSGGQPCLGANPASSTWADLGLGWRFPTLERLPIHLGVRIRCFGT